MYGRLMPTRELGRTGIHVSPIGLGTMQFSGSGMVSAFFPPLRQPAADQITRSALDGGITWFDTAEMYGHGHSERRLSGALSTALVKPGDVIVATKWTPTLRTANNIGQTIDDRLSALDPFPIDLHQIHLGIGSFSPVRSQVAAMARLVEAGKIRAVGVSNFSARQMEIAHAELAKRGIALASNQIKVNLLHRNCENNGVLETARQLGVTLIAYSPLASGMLTGKFHEDRSLVARMPRARRLTNRFSDRRLDRTAPLIDGMRDVARTHSATVGQVALAWLIRYYGDTVVAIPGASKPHHAAEAAAAMKVVLSQQETARLAELSGSVGG
jgi:aryl-alcohol dehydrogenase-like predicted oxidoreductase